MIDQMPIVTKRAVRTVGAPVDLAPPLAPLTMPKQVLTRGRGPVRRALALMIARVEGLRHGVRRIG